MNYGVKIYFEEEKSAFTIVALCDGNIMTIRHASTLEEANRIAEEEEAALFAEWLDEMVA